MLQFESDYMEGAHPKLLEALIRVNTEKTTGYGQDDHCFRAAPWSLTFPLPIN